MARPIQLSAEVSFLARPMLWTVGIAEYIGWEDQYYGRPVAKFRVLEPQQYAGLVGTVTRGLSPEISNSVPRQNPEKFSRKLNKATDRIRVEVLISDEAPGTDLVEEKPQKFDAWAMRANFLRLKGDSISLVEFLSRYGEWGDNTNPRLGLNKAGNHELVPTIVMPAQIWYAEDKRERKANFKELLKRRKEFLPLQDLIRWGLVCGQKKWFSSEYGGCSLDGPRPEFPHFVIKKNTCFDALLSTVSLDYLAGAKHRLCARPDCRMPFALESRHSRLYCTQYCAHLESVRRSRQRART